MWHRGQHKSTKFQTLGILEGESKTKGIGNEFNKIKTVNFLSFARDTGNQNQVLQTYSTKNIFSKAYYSLAVRRQRDNSRNSKRNCQVTYKGILIRLTADLSAETLQTRNEWDSIFKVLKENIFQPRRLYPPRYIQHWKRNKIFLR